jgi:hypothetical protein
VTVTASVAFYFSSVLGQLLLSLHKTSLTPATLVMFHLGVLFAWQTINLMPIRPIGYLSIVSGKHARFVYNASLWPVSPLLSSHSCQYLTASLCICIFFVVMEQGVFMVALAVALISVMLSLAGIEPSMAHVPFTAVLNYSGSSSAVYAALSSTLMASFVFCPQDTIIRMVGDFFELHKQCATRCVLIFCNSRYDRLINFIYFFLLLQAEESRRPERALPKLMVGSTVSSLLIGLPLVIVLNYGIIKTIRGLLDEPVPGIKIILVKSNLIRHFYA